LRSTRVSRPGPLSRGALLRLPFGALQKSSQSCERILICRLPYLWLPPLRRLFRLVIVPLSQRFANARFLFGATGKICQNRLSHACGGSRYQRRARLPDALRPGSRAVRSGSGNTRTESDRSWRAVRQILFASFVFLIHSGEAPAVFGLLASSARSRAARPPLSSWAMPFDDGETGEFSVKSASFKGPDLRQSGCLMCLRQMNCGL
jgi:hypothetical protein